MRINRRLIAAALIAFAAAIPARAQFTKSTLSTQIGTQFPDNSTGAITPATTRTWLNGLVNSFQQFPAVNPQAGTTYAFVIGDYGQLVTFNNAAPVAVTLPQAAGTFSIWNSYVANLGAGVVTITPATSTINGASTLVLSQGQSAWIVADGTNYQVFRGNSLPFSGTAGALLCYTNTTTIGSSFTATGNGVIFANGSGNGTCPGYTASGTNGQLLFGVNTSAPQFSTLSQDCTVTNAGVITCTKTNNVSFTAGATAAVGQLPGTATNDSATSGNVGEIVPSTVLLGSAVVLSTGVPANVTSISLTAGDWDVWAEGAFDGPGTTNVTGMRVSVSTTTGTEVTTAGNFASVTGAGTSTFSTFDATLTAGPVRESLSGTTTVFMVARCNFTVSACNAYGVLRARRVR